MYVGRTEQLPAVEAWIAANRQRFKPGVLTQVEIMHDAPCRYPQGGDCTCVEGPEIKVVGEDSTSN
jgi:hypothetical protein